MNIPCTPAEIERRALAALPAMYGKALKDVDPQEELAALLSEAAVELENLDGSQNIVAKRLRAMMRRVDGGEVVVKWRDAR